MSDTTSIDAAAAAVDTLLALLELSNARFVQAQDMGIADAYVFGPTPAVTSYGPDLFMVVDIANPNQTQTPKANVSGLGWVNVTASDGSPVAIGALAGKCVLGFSAAAGGGYVARHMFALSAAMLAALIAANGSSIYVGTLTGTNALTTTLSPAVASMAAIPNGSLVILIPGGTNAAGAVTVANVFNGNATGAMPLKQVDGASDPLAGELRANRPVIAVKLGSTLLLRSPSAPTAASSATFATSSAAATGNAVVTTANLQAPAGGAPSWASVANGIVTILQDGVYTLDGFYAIQGYIQSTESGYTSGNLVISGNSLLPGGVGLIDAKYVAGDEIYAGTGISYTSFLAAGTTVKLVAQIGSSNGDLAGCTLSSAFINITKR